MASRTKATEVVEVVETKPLTPKELAAELNINPKRLRAYLRKEHTRATELKNSSWAISDEAAAAAREYFAPKDDDEESA